VKQPEAERGWTQKSNHPHRHAAALVRPAIIQKPRREKVR